MESHYFTEPEPVVDRALLDALAVAPAATDADDGAAPVWRVRVMRYSAAEPVATLYVSRTNLPPRRSTGHKKKILWKLPDAAAGGNPTFGEHERKRLWELFKLQKKERRKKDAAAVANATASTADAGIAATVSTADAATSISLNVGNSTHATLSVQSNGEEPLVAASVARPPPPPPGFSIGSRSLESAQNQQPSAPTAIPPGLAPRMASATTSHATTPTTNPTQLPQQQQVPPPPPAVSVTTTLSASTTALSASSSSSLLLLLSPPRYFVWNSTHEPPSAMATRVAATFLQSMQNAVRPAAWLQYYCYFATEGSSSSSSSSSSPNKTLLIGSAQAVCSTAQDCLQQVQSLSTPGASAWECHGCTIQSMPRSTNARTAAATATSFVVVLTGRTVQQGETLAFNSTLVLQAVNSTTVHNNTTNNADDDDNNNNAGTVFFQITNDVLSLFALNVATPTTPVPVNSI